MGLAIAALETIPQRLGASLEDFRFHTFGVKDMDHFLNSPHGRAMDVAAAV